MNVASPYALRISVIYARMIPFSKSAATYAFFLSGFIFGLAQCQAFSDNLYNHFGQPGINASYDYVVIGGGTAGNAIAARLAEIPGISVAVVEAGGFYQIEGGNGSIVPGFSPTHVSDPLTDWGYFTQPMAGALNRSISYARGKTLGGSSALNYMVYQRGTKGSFQHWADLVGDQNWTWENVFPFYKKTPTYYPPNETLRKDNSTVTQDLSAFDYSLHGPIQVGLQNYAAPIGSWALKALAAVGVPTIDGLNSGKLLGAAWSVCSIDQKYQRRSSSQTGYLDAAMKNTGIQIYTHTLAKQILFDETKTAYAVKVQSSKRTYFLHAGKEIILSGGAYNSPQLLMVSGIGPSSTLQKLNIPVIVDLPGVGQNMEDHPIFNVARAVTLETTSRIFVPTPENRKNVARAIEQYNVNASGVLTGIAGILGWEKVQQPLRSTLKKSTLATLAKYPADWPELEILVQNGYPGRFPIDVTKDYASVGIGLVAPISRGYVTINSTDTSDLPLVNPNYFSDAQGVDIDLAIAGIKRAREVWSRMAAIHDGEELAPGKAAQSDADIELYIRGAVTPIFHPACTCKMGKKGDKMAVVDSQAKVFGVAALRVVDASSFGTLVPGHPQATVYMFAEKIADLIRRGLSTGGKN